MESNSAYSISTPRSTTSEIERKDMYKEKYDEMVRLIKKIQEKSQCQICLETPEHPHMIICNKKCKQNVCYHCIKNLKKANKSEQFVFCPICKDTKSIYIQCGISVKNVFENIPKNCEYCHQIVIIEKNKTNIESLQSHYEKCDDYLIECKNKEFGCKVRYKRKDRYLHVKESCQHIPCSNYVGKIEFKKYGCSKVGNLIDIRKHQHECKSIIRISEIKQIYQHYENVMNSMQDKSKETNSNKKQEIDNSDIDFLLHKCTTIL